MLGMAVAFSLLLQGTFAVQPGMVAGQVHTREGAPAVAVRVSAIPAPPPNIRPADGQNYYTIPPPVSTALTSDQGRYRLANIPPGRYYIVAGMIGQATFYPATTDLDRATVVTIAANSMTEDLDFKLLMPLGGRVSGRVIPAPVSGAPEKAILSGLKLTELLEVPVGPDGAFEFGRLPRGAYLLSLLPTPPGLASQAFEVGDEDEASLEFVRPPLRTVTGRIVVQNGPLPLAMLAFSTLQSYVAATINPDGTFRARLHSARHRTELAGMPVGYSVVSVRAGSADVSPGLAVGDADVSDVVITVAAPRYLPRIRGQVAGVERASLSGARVELTGPIIGSLEAPVQQDGSFEFAAVTPGRYRLRLPQVPELAPVDVVLNGNDSDVQVVISGR
jgi:hypothetical protein